MNARRKARMRAAERLFGNPRHPVKIVSMDAAGRGGVEVLETVILEYHRPWNVYRVAHLFQVTRGIAHGDSRAGMLIKQDAKIE